MYHFSCAWCAASGAPGDASPGVESATIDELRQVRPCGVEHHDQGRRDHRHDDDDDRRCADFLAGGPGHLLELTGDLVGQGVNAIVAVEHDHGHEGDEAGEQGDVEL